MQEWEKVEDDKYSDLYENGYPDGDPEKLPKWAKTDYNGSVLDLGCGKGRLSLMYSNYIGVDVAASVIAMNKEKYPNKEFIHCGMSEVNEILSDRKFDLVVCADVIEHLPPDEVVSVIKHIGHIDANLFLFGVSTRASRLLAKNGDNLHLTVMPPKKWIEIFEKYYKILDWHMANTSLIYIKCIKKEEL